jgi:hypothetical protein
MEPPRPTSVWLRLQQIPRLYVYLLLAAVVVWQLLFPIHIPIVPSAATRGVHEAIEAVPDDKIVIICADWDASTQAETGPQTRSLAHTCFQERKRFAILNIAAPMGHKLAHDIAEEVAKDYRAEYGRDWCNWGYKVGFRNVLLTLAKDVPKAVGNDYYGKPVTQLPMMQGVHDVKDVGLVIEVSGLAGVIEPWIGLIQGPHQVPFSAAVTAVMAPGYYPFLDSGQMEGMLVGARGAAEMEVLMARPGMGQAIMSAQSWAHVLIIALIILGNLGYLLARRRAGERET